MLWLALTEPRFCSLSDEGNGAAALDPALLRAPEFRATPGILELGMLDPGVLNPASIAMLGLRAMDGAFAVDSYGYGPAGDRLATDLAAQVEAWDVAGRPDAARLRITAYPRDTPSPADGIVIDKAHTRLVVTVRR
jgi:protein-L-isoaspartate(D-aspartate) O-methyltransferase